jgi:hypothetical protein
MRPRMSGAGSWIAWTRTRDAGAFVVVLIMTLVTATEAASDAVESKTLTFRYSRVVEFTNCSRLAAPLVAARLNVVSKDRVGGYDM